MFVRFIASCLSADKKSAIREKNVMSGSVIKELPVALECELIKVIDDNKYLGRIKNVSVDEKRIRWGWDEVEIRFLFDFF